MSDIETIKRLYRLGHTSSHIGKQLEKPLGRSQVDDMITRLVEAGELTKLNRGTVTPRALKRDVNPMKLKLATSETGIAKTYKENGVTITVCKPGWAQTVYPQGSVRAWA